MTKPTRTGMIGLGAMGLPMAGHQKRHGFEACGCDVSPEAQKRAREAGIIVYDTPAEVGAHSDVVIVMVATDDQVIDVVVKSGLLDTMKPGSVIAIASSVAPATCQELEKLCAQHKIGLLDTPVVLGQEACNEGTMVTFVGGTEEAYTHAEPALSPFSSKVLYVGKSGSGQLTKTLNNMLLWACMSANYEALSFAKATGADVPKLIEALKYSSGANWSLSRWGKSTGKWAEKDMDHALELAQEAKTPVPLAALVDQLMKGMNQQKMLDLLK